MIVPVLVIQFDLPIHLSHITADIATLKNLNRTKISNRLSFNLGPTIKQSFTENPEIDLALASNTTLRFVVPLSSFITQ